MKIIIETVDGDKYFTDMVLFDHEGIITFIENGGLINLPIKIINSITPEKIF